MNAAQRYLWGCVVPAAAIVLGLSLILPALWVPASPPVDPGLFLPNRAFRAHPEPREQLRYTLAVTTVPVLLWWMARRRPTRLPGVTAAIVIRALFVLFVVAAALYEELRVAPLFGAPAVVGALGASCAIAVAYARRSSVASSASRAGALRWSPALLAAAISAAYLLPSIYRGGMRRITLHVWLHAPVPLGEPAAVWAGLTPLVDYVPQYQLLISYLLLPVCAVFGPSVTTLTTSAAVLSFLGLMAVYDAFRRLSGNGWSALLLVVPFVGLSFMPLDATITPERLTAFTYFNVGLCRLLGPWLTFAAMSGFLERPSAWRRTFAVAMGTIAALNNIDFGIPALVGVLVAIALYETPTLRGSAAHLRSLVATFVAAAAAAVLLLGVVSYARTGSLPDLRELIFYQRAYALSGYMMLPLPPFGFHWVFYATYMAAIALGLLQRPEARLCRGLLLFTGIFGAGATAYYIGRSHPQVLVLVLSPWALCLAVLTFAVVDDARRQASIDATAVRTFDPTVVVLGAAWLLGMWQLHDAPNPWRQLARIEDVVPMVAGASAVSLGSVRSWSPAASTELVELIRSATQPGEPVAIVYPFGHVLARRAGVRNVYRYTDDESLVLVAQLQDLLQRIAADDVRQVFGRTNQPLAQALAAAGFHEARVLGDFTWWTRNRV